MTLVKSKKRKIKEEEENVSPSKDETKSKSAKIETTEESVETMENQNDDLKIVEIRRVEYRKRLSWMCVCPHCSIEYSDLVTHIKQNHPGKEHRGLRAQCPQCNKLVVDIQNHIRQVHEKLKNFKCEECENTFSKKGALEIHVKSVHRKLMTECPHCNLSCRLTHLKTHIQNVHTKPRPRVKCEQCDKDFCSKADMQRHMLNVHMKYKLKCEFCDKELIPELMTRHIRTKHQGIHKVYCKLCQQGFDYQRSLEMHMSTYHSGIFIQCNIPLLGVEGEYCKKKHVTEIALKEHIMGHLDKDYKVLCKDCGEEIYSCYQEEHQQRCHPKPDSKISCDFDGCIAAVDTRDDMLEHIQESHPTMLEYLDWCKLCSKPVVNLDSHTSFFHKNFKDKEFTLLTRVCFGVMCKEEGCKFFGKNQTSVDRHVKLTHNKAILSDCDICKKPYRDVEKHKRDVHSKEKIHICQFCTSTFQTKRKLLTHQRVHNRGKKECDVCGAKVTHLKQHVHQVHGNIRPFSCDVEGCNTRFFSKLSKSKHVMHVHEGLKYKCEICSQEVINIKLHMRFVHMKEKRHKCPECDKLFQTSSHMRTHVARVHLKVKMTCPECGKSVQDLNHHQLAVHRQAKNYPCDQCDRRFNTMSQLKTHLGTKHLTEV